MKNGFNILGLMMCFFGTLMLAWSLNPALQRINDALSEIEKSINALRDGNRAGSYEHLGQNTKYKNAAKYASNGTTAGLAFVVIGTALQFFSILLG